MEYYSALERQESLTSAATGMNSEDFTWWEKPDTEGQTLYDSTYLRD